MSTDLQPPTAQMLLENSFPGPVFRWLVRLAHRLGMGDPTTSVVMACESHAERSAERRRQYQSRALSADPTAAGLFFPGTCEPLNADLSYLGEVIYSSLWLLDLEDDWDDAGSRGYDVLTWQRAITFLVRNAQWLWDTYGSKLEAPKILPGPDGSIDILWESPSQELLLNVPTDPGAPLTFYGDDRGALSIKGTLSLSAYNRGLLMWLREIH